MSYDVDETVLITFEDRPDLEIRAEIGTIGESIEMLNDRYNDSVSPQEFMRRRIERFIAHLISWNLQKRGKDVPMTEEGFLSLPDTLGMKILNAYMEAGRGGVSAPLPAGSQNGGPALVASMTTEALSPSHPN